QQIYLTSLRTKLDALAPASAANAQPSALRRQTDQIYAQALAIVRDSILPAHQRASAALTALRPRATHDAGIWRLPNGEAYYRALLKEQTTTNLSADEIHNIGLNRIRELN